MFRCLLITVLAYASVAATAQPVPFVEDFTSELTTGIEHSLAALWGDYDSDGDLDLLVTDVEAEAYDRLFRNEGQGSFSRLLFQTNEDPFAVTNSGSWVDFDNDGDLDLVTSSLSDGSVFRNLGSDDGVPNFEFVPTILDDYEDQRAVELADYNGDGLMDGLLVRRFGVRNILVSDLGGDGEEVDIGIDVGDDLDDSNSACWGDVNNDGYKDLYIANSSPVNHYYVNGESGLVRDVTQPFLDLEGISAACAWGDYDADGDLDIAVTLSNTMTQGGTQLFRNNAGSFAPAPLEDRQLSTTGLAWGDVDNDGDLDLVVAHREGQSPTLYRNDGAGAFTFVDFGDGLFSVALALVDDDEDGDLDLFITNGGFNFGERNQLFRNTTDGTGNWLEVELRRSDGRNRYGVGAHIYAYAMIGGVERTLLRPVQTSSGWNAQDGYRAHFGLGDAAVVDSIVVVWPMGIDDAQTVAFDVNSNQIVTIDENGIVVSAEEVVPSGQSFALEGTAPNPTHGSVTATVRSGSGEPVRVEVFDLQGRRVRVFEIPATPGGRVLLRWDGTDEQSRPVASGLYFLRVQQGDDAQVARVTLLR